MQMLNIDELYPPGKLEVDFSMTDAQTKRVLWMKDEWIGMWGNWFGFCLWLPTCP